MSNNVGDGRCVGRRAAGPLEAMWRGMPAFMRRCGLLIRE
jgi:hypothetical protein